MRSGPASTDAEVAAQALDHRQQGGDIGGVAGPQEGGDGPIILIHHRACYFGGGEELPCLRRHGRHPDAVGRLMGLGRSVGGMGLGRVSGHLSARVSGNNVRIGVIRHGRIACGV